MGNSNKIYPFLPLFFLVMAPLGAIDAIFSQPGEGLTLEADFAPTWKTKYKNHIIVYKKDSLGNLSSPSFDMHDVTKLRALGMQARAEYTFSPKGSIEGIFQGLYHWHYRRDRLSSAGDLGVPITPFVSTEWGSMQSVFIYYDERYNSFEANALPHLTPRYVDYFSFTLICGARYINHEDFIALNGVKDIAFSHVANSLDIRDNNELFGFQLGMDLQYMPTKRFLWSIPIKFGAYINHITQGITLTGDNSNKYLEKSHRVKDVDSFTIDFSPSLNIMMGPAFLKFTYQYQGLFNIALAPSQIRLTNSLTRISWHKDLYMQSGMVGVGVNF